jgi:hypothetical protein
MWCTACKIAFDWTIGQIIYGRIHNPHYFEWLTDMSRNEAQFNVHTLKISKKTARLLLNIVHLRIMGQVIVSDDTPEMIISNREIIKYVLEISMEFRNTDGLMRR